MEVWIEYIKPGKILPHCSFKCLDIITIVASLAWNIVDTDNLKWAVQEKDCQYQRKGMEIRLSLLNQEKIEISLFNFFSFLFWPVVIGITLQFFHVVYGTHVYCLQGLSINP